MLLLYYIYLIIVFRKRKLRKSNHRQPPVKTLGSPSSSTCSQANDTINYNSVKRHTDAQKINDIRNSRPTSTERDRLNQEPHFQHYYSENNINNIAATENPSSSHSHRPSTSSYTKGVQGWRNLRAVMLYYCSLRRIKRNGAQNINLFLCLILQRSILHII